MALWRSTKCVIISINIMKNKDNYQDKIYSKT